MTASYSADCLLTFLKDVVVAGHMPAATARSRSQAARALMAYFTEGERNDLRILELDALRARLAEDQGGSLRPEVADLYIERFECALEDFLPFAEALGESETGIAPQPVPAAEYAPEERPEDRRALESARLRFDRNRSDIVPIPLPRGSTVYVHGLPPDLSPAEAEKIARVVAALADDGDHEA